MLAAKDKDPDVSKVAAATFWTFHREVIPLRNRAD